MRLRKDWLVGEVPRLLPDPASRRTLVRAGEERETALDRSESRQVECTGLPKKSVARGFESESPRPAVFIGEVVERLRSEGFLATVDRIRHAVKTGYLKPFPRKSSLGARVFTDRQLQQLRQYMVDVRRGPKPRRPPDTLLPIGYLDSIRRSQRAKELDAQINRLRAMLGGESGDYGGAKS